MDKSGMVFPQLWFNATGSNIVFILLFISLLTTGTWRMDSGFHWLFMCLGLSSRLLQRVMPKFSILNKLYKMAPSTNDYISKRYESVQSTMKGVQI